MSRSYYSGSSRSPMDEYLEHITKMLKTPSDIPDFPDFPNVYKALNNNNSSSSSSSNNKWENHPKKMSYMNHQKHWAPEAHKKVHYVESEDKDIAVEGPEDHDFFRQNHKNFGLCKWYTNREF